MTAEQNFESRLLAELRAVVSERPAPAAPTRRRRVVLPGAGAAVAAASAVAVVIATGGDTPSAAYGVESRPDGVLTVTIRTASDADGLERRLRAAGVPADVSYNGAGEACPFPVPRIKPNSLGAGTVQPGGASEPDERVLQTTPQPAGAASRSSPSLDVRFDPDGDSVTFSVDPDAIPAGQRLVIATSDDNVGSLGVAIAPRGGTDIVCGVPPTGAR